MLAPRPVTVVEVDPFSSHAADVWSESECHDFISYIAANPLAGAVISDTGGLRKVRWSRHGGGKRGGVRVIYYFYNERAPVFLLSVFAKNVRDDLSPMQKKRLVKLAGILKATYR